MAIYHTIAKEGEGKYTEKMSRFLSFAVHVSDPEEARLKIKEFQNRYHDSRHVCWAYMIGPDRTQWQLNDNGEPSGTAGKPILGQINSRELTDVLVVVVRYFGGIKLGTSGLIVAYREAAALALDDAGRMELHEMETIKVGFGYELMDGIMRVIKNEKLNIIEKKFDNLCEITIEVKKDDADRVGKFLSDRGGNILEN